MMLGRQHRRGDQGGLPRQPEARALEAHDREQEPEPVVLDEVGHPSSRLRKIAACASASRGSSSQASADEAARLRSGQILIGFLEPLTDAAGIERLADHGVYGFAMESIPRTTRAQPMDALSSQATVSGYKAVLIAADRLPRFFPMLMTAAGTVAPAKVLVVGAGVAGLQAIATARRLGAVVEAYDVRAAAAEEVRSMGASFVELELDS